ncbi:MAG: cytochrome c3 family protein, partial [Rubricoccaceae bacterium]|nr:cytochrome c3 family protein [Rubricoccaceae bacterium]
MPQLFPRKANALPGLSLLLVLGGGLVVTLAIWYWFSPRFTDVGYQPEQPVPYSHALHAGQLGMDCRYCHNLVETSEHANVPSTQTCMNCHSQIRTESLKLLPVRESWATGNPIPWVNVHFLPDYVQFSHAVHINVGVGCESCHGRVDQMEVVSLEEPLSMGWCLDCHRNPAEELRDPALVTQMGFRDEVRADDETYRTYVESNETRIA